jgi:uncharacterized Zn-finger protein
MITVCQYCSRNFSSNSNLKYHQKHARYCVQNRSNGTINCIECKFCKKTFTTKYNLKDHYDVCIDKKYNNISVEYQIKIKGKREKIKSLTKELNQTKKRKTKR